ncbi:MAG TPA: hemolysin family protein [Actinomycetota bacterium]|nr:hemolysin family protein [Actinomycetota bacterium]
MTFGYLLAAIALLLANGFFVGAEFALVAARRSRIEQLAAEGNPRARVALRSVRELSFMLAGAQLGITMASLGLGAVAEPAVAHLIEGALHPLELSPTALHSTAFVIALAIVVFFHMVIGEMAPKNIAIAEPERSALGVAVPFRLFANLFRPFITLLNVVANAGVRALRVEPKDEIAVTHSPDEIASMISESAESGYIDPFQHRLLANIIDFRQRDAASIMVPRPDMVALPASATVAEVERVAVETGHSRIPIYRDNLDQVLGFFHAKDLLRLADARRDAALPADLIRQMLVVPESRDLYSLFIDMRRERRHFALVVDEHGGTAGIVTLEDLLEELVGEIRDEYDVTEPDIERLGPDRVVIPGNFTVHEAQERAGLELPEGDYETVAGFVMDRLGRIPKRRDVVEHGNWRLRVLSMRRRRILRVLIERSEGAPESSAGDEN